MVTEGIIIAFITGGLAIASNVVVAAFQNSKTIYRIDELEKKVEKHNNLVERMVILEQSEQAQWSWIDHFKVDQFKNNQGIDPSVSKKMP